MWFSPVERPGASDVYCLVCVGVDGRGRFDSKPVLFDPPAVCYLDMQSGYQKVSNLAVAYPVQANELMFT